VQARAGSPEGAATVWGNAGAEKWAITGGVAAAVLAVAGFVALMLYVRRKRKSAATASPYGKMMVRFCCLLLCCDV
jgi:hypothetical protein